MLNRLPPLLVGCLSFTLHLVNTLIWCLPLYGLTLVKLLSRRPQWRQRLDPLLCQVASAWIRGANRITCVTQQTSWDIEGPQSLDRRGWYLVIANHQSWVDVMVLLRTFGIEIPFPRFFTKRQMLWIPLLGAALWALEFPIMRRYPRHLRDRNAKLKGADLAATRRSCQRSLHHPVSIVNFLEGTRYTDQKHAAQQSPYRHLLRPKAGGMALVLNVLGEKLHGILDVTIVYPQGRPTFWAFLCGRVKNVSVRVRVLEAPAHLRSGDYAEDEGFRKTFQAWVGRLWQEKDEQIDNLLARYRTD